MTDTVDPCSYTPASTEWIKSHLDRMDHPALSERRDSDRDTVVETTEPTTAARRMS